MQRHFRLVKPKRDLHIHTIFSHDDGFVMHVQTDGKIGVTQCAEITSICDHFGDMQYHDAYLNEVIKHNHYIGPRVDSTRKIDVYVNRFRSV